MWSVIVGRSNRASSWSPPSPAGAAGSERKGCFTLLNSFTKAVTKGWLLKPNENQSRNLDALPVASFPAWNHNRRLLFYAIQIGCGFTHGYIGVLTGSTWLLNSSQPLLLKEILKPFLGSMVQFTGCAIASWSRYSFQELFEDTIENSIQSGADILHPTLSSGNLSAKDNVFYKNTCNGQIPFIRISEQMGAIKDVLFNGAAIVGAIVATGGSLVILKPLLFYFLTALVVSAVLRSLLSYTCRKSVSQFFALIYMLIPMRFWQHYENVRKKADNKDDEDSSEEESLKDLKEFKTSVFENLTNTQYGVYAYFAAGLVIDTTAYVCAQLVLRQYLFHQGLAMGLQGQDFDVFFQRHIQKLQNALLSPLGYALGSIAQFCDVYARNHPLPLDLKEVRGSS